ncbi:LPXTG-motif cell wall anchor domain-containing protein [Glycomyces sambucus]|uniref:LPXTG-motif cell wall anchor domain-containing protein n=1 Tax=Glycomyces sambucus TaxID=380244 RepID=A0A1G9H1N5_9ACTN|nr:LPXTG cell wall anchor domain-containing protein [Glycomyces sambucus]SDL06870.1 LPXTG-motif cell wall anchor domain-containing protein [Glycomyces sambucus]
MTPPLPHRAGRRLAAVLAALLAGALAVPAAAQAQPPAETNYDFNGPVNLGDAPLPGGFTLVFGDDFTPGAHTVTVALDVDAAPGTFAFTTGDQGALPCTHHGTGVDCVRDAAEAELHFAFLFAAADDAQPGVYGYTATATVDGTEVDTYSGAIEIVDPFPAQAFPFRHANLAHTGVEPGATVDVFPEFLQQDAFDPGTGAVVLTFTEPEYAAYDQGADAIAAYDNCAADHAGRRGVVCVVTDLTDAPGTVFTTTGPVPYEVDPLAPGPFDVCVCYYSATTVSKDERESTYGDITWDEDGHVLGLRAVADPELEYSDPTVGELDIVTREHFYDLAIGDADARGAAGDERTLTVPIRNDGPATAFGLFGIHSYYVTGALPDGLDLVRVDSDGREHWDCLDDDEAAELLPEVDAGASDFLCMFDRLDAGGTIAFTFTVEVTDPGSTDRGVLEVHGRNNAGIYPGVLEDDLADNTGSITVNAVYLPDTGASLTWVLAGALAALVAGAVLFAATRRRSGR